MDANKILNALENIVKGSTIELRGEAHYPFLEVDEVSWLYKDYDGKLIWKRSGEEFKASELDSDGFCLLLDLLHCNAIIPYSEYVSLMLS